MGAAKHPKASLLPSGQSLDLFVTLTDYHGYQQLVQIHDPPLIHELDHHHILHFTYRRRSSGEVESDFDLDNAAGPRLRRARDLVVPRRLSAGADRGDGRGGGATARRLAAARRVHRQRISRITCAPTSTRPRPPFSTARCSTTGRSRKRSRRSMAARPIARSIGAWSISIPHPAPPAARRHHKVPGFFATLRGALSDIPSSQPVTDELGRVVEFNEQVRRLRAIIDSARPQVSQLVAKVVTTRFDRAISTDDLRSLARAGELARRASTPALPTSPMSGSSSPPCAPSAPS